MSMLDGKAPVAEYTTDFSGSDKIMERWWPYIWISLLFPDYTALLDCSYEIKFVNLQTNELIQKIPCKKKTNWLFV